MTFVQMMQYLGYHCSRNLDVMCRHSDYCGLYRDFSDIMNENKDEVETINGFEDSNILINLDKYNRNSSQFNDGFNDGNNDEDFANEQKNLLMAQEAIFMEILQHFGRNSNDDEFPIETKMINDNGYDYELVGELH